MLVVLLGMNSVVCALQTAGTVQVDLDVNDLSVSDGDKITSWVNNGDLPSAFTNAIAGEGAIFRTNVAGAAAVEFTGSANTIMKSPDAVPTALTTNNSWSVEVWVNNPALSTSEECYLAWTPRGDSDDSDTLTDYELMELRYYNSSLALEHYAHNAYWGARGRPAAGQWHYLVFTRDKSTNIEKIYVNGGFNNQATLAQTRIRPDGVFTLGGTENAGQTGYQLLYSGYIGKVRIHTGTLTAAQVAENYIEERDEYGVTAAPDSAWTGTAGSALDWADSANWAGGAVPENGSYVTIDNGGIPLYTNVAATTIEDITTTKGGLIISNNASLYVNDTRSTSDWDHLGSGAGNEYDLTIASGRLEFTGTGNHTLRFGYTGASSTGQIGVDGTAELVVDNDLHIGYSLNGTLASTGIVNIATGGSVETLNGASGIDIGLYQNAYGEVNVNGGILGGADTANITLSYNGGHSKLTLNSGSIETPGDLRFARGNAAFASTDARLILNGGELEARRIYAVYQTGLQQIWLNGGTIRNTDSRSDFFYNLDTAWLQNGGVTFDIISGTEVDAAQPLIEDSGSTGGGITKNGEGTLILSGTNTFTGDITVNAGTLLFSNADGLIDGYSGEITLNDADAAIGYSKDYGVDELLAILDTNTVGRIVVLSGNATNDIDFSDFPYLELGFDEGVDYTGTFTPYGSTYTLYPVGAGNLFSQSVTGISDVEVYGTEEDEIEFTGDSSYSGGTLIDGCDLIVSHVNALGSGDITLTNGAVLKLNVAGLPDTFAQRITAGSKGFIMLTTLSTNVNLNLTGLPGIQVGTELDSLTYSGDITPADSTYRFTGGGQEMRASPNFGLIVSGLDGANAVVAENGNEDREFVNDTFYGGISLGSGNTYTGGTVITNKGLIRIDGDDFGAVPSTFDADNIYMNDGCIRLGQANITFDENRGLKVGPLGAELHPWGGYTFAFMGSISGTGEISSTDGGTVIFGGTNNTWGGTLDLDVGTMAVGSGSNFSWNNSALLVGAGGSFGVNYDGALTWSTEFDNPLGTDGADMGFRKMGSGTLTVDDDQLYTRNTQVDGGVLKVASANAIPHGTGKGDLVVNSGAAVDVNGYDISVNGLSGEGNIRDDDGAASTLTAGEDGSSSTFSGSIEPDLELVKIGSGTLTLTGDAAVKDATVSVGVLELANPAAPTGTVTIADDATLLVTGDSSDLIGYFYDYTLSTPSVLNTLSGVRTLFSGRTPSVISPLTDTVTSFDFGSAGTGFPAPYNAASRNGFIVQWEGRFLAETAGDYTFWIKSDDGSSLFIDGQVVLANGANQSFGQNEPTATITLSAGYHDFLVAYSENSGDQGLIAYVAVPGGTKTPIPASLLTGVAPSVITSISSGNDGLLQIEDNATVVLDLDANTTFDGRIDGGTGGGAVLVKDGAATLNIESSGNDVEGITSIEEGTLHIESGSDSVFGRMNIESGAELSINVLGTGVASPDLVGEGLTGYYYDYSAAQPDPYTALDSGDLATVEAHLAGQTIDLVENSTTSADVFYFYSDKDGSVITDVDRTGSFPDGYENTSYFDVIWYGQIIIPEDGTYQLRTSSDDGSMIYIDGELVVANQGRHDRQWSEDSDWDGSGPVDDPITLTAGIHDIAITFYEVGGGDIMVAQIKMPGSSTFVALPNSMLRPEMFQIGALSGEGALTVDALSGALLINQAVDTTFAGDIAATNTAVIFKDGASTLTLTGDNSAHYGSWSILEGALQVGDGSTSGTLGGSNLYVKAGAELIFNCPDDIVYTGAVSGDGIIRSIGGGTVTLAGDLSGFTGVMDVNASGVLELSSASQLAISAITNAGVVIIGEGVSVSGLQIAGDGTTVVADGGLLDIGSDLATNDIELDGGMLRASATNALASLAVSTNGTSELLLDVTEDGQAFDVADLVLEAGSRLEVEPVGGLISRYYDVQPGTSTYNSVSAFINWASGQTVALATNTVAQGVGLEFGNQGQFFPGKYNSVTGTKLTGFSAIYKGRIAIAVAGEYKFGVSSDDNGMLYINDQLIVDNNGGHGYQLREGTVTLTAGVHDFCMLFGQGTGGYGLTAHITYPGETSSQVLPNSILIPDSGDGYDYTLAAASVSVINAPGAGTVATGGDGTLTFPDLSVELDSNLAVEGAAAVDGTTLDITIDQEIPDGRTLVGDFTGATGGLDLSGVTMTLTGSEGELYYTGDKLYIRKSGGTILILR